MDLFRYLGLFISDLLEQFDDALIPLDVDAAWGLPCELTGVPVVVDLVATS